jgi:uncharacterized protein (TIGR02452 family)
MTSQPVSTTQPVSTAPSFLNSITDPIAEFAQKNTHARIMGIACAILGLGIGAFVISSPIPITLRALLTIGSSLCLGLAAAIFHFSRQAVAGVAPDKESQMKYRAEIMQQTLANLRDGSYVSPDGMKHTLNVQGPANNVKQHIGFDGEFDRPFQRPGTLQTKVSIQNKDCLYVAEDLHKRSLNPCVLDMAANRQFGGAYREGSPAQEEELCRRSTLSVIEPTTKKYYPLNDKSRTAGLYVPEVAVFRAGYDKFYQYLNEPFSIGVGVIAAKQNPHLANERLANAADLHNTRGKIRAFFDMAHKNGHKSVVFGALGCGAFKNPPGHIAEIALDVIEKEFKSCFDEIVFAVIDDGNTKKEHNPEGNFVPFERAINAYNAKNQASAV